MPSPLASIFSTVDSAKRSLLDILTNPVASAQQIVGNANDRAGVLNQLTSQVAGQTRDSIKAGGSLMPDTPESQQLTQMMADAYNPIGMTVFHGSPYKFNAFDSSRMGSGAGAQAYGKGTYLTDQTDFAKGYVPRDYGYEESLSKMYSRSERNQDYDSMGVLESAMMHSTPQELRKMYGEGAESLIKQIEAIPQSGSLYKVDLPDEHIANMLDWNSEIGKQSKTIQDLARLNKLSMDDLGGDLVAAMGAKESAGAEAMRAAGIPGIKYVDGQMRGGSVNPQNFVVFPGNEGLLQILERNGVPLK